MDTNIGIKEECPVSKAGLENETDDVSSFSLLEPDSITISSGDEHKNYTKLEIKQEAWWLERTNEMQHDIEILASSHTDIQTHIVKDSVPSTNQIVEDFPPGESHRLYAEANCSDNSNSSCIFNDASLETQGMDVPDLGRTNIDDELLTQYSEMLSESEDDYFIENSEESAPNTPSVSPQPKKRCLIASNGTENTEKTAHFEEDPVDVDINDEENSYQEAFVEVFPDEANCSYKPPFSFSEVPGPKHMPPHDSPPISYFSLFFTTSLFNVFVNETNSYADYYLMRNTKLSINSRSRLWQKTTVSEMKAFIAVILNMGLIRKPNLASYWSTVDHLSTPWFASIFSRNRFQLLLKFFNLVDASKLRLPGCPDYDPCAPVRPLLEHANKTCPYYYTPHEQLSVEGTSCSSNVRQAKYWTMSDAVSKYCLSFSTYHEAVSNEEKHSVKQSELVHTVVTNLLSTGNYSMKGHHIYTDPFFTSVSLAKHLYSLRTFNTGIILRHRKGLPNALKATFKSVGNKYFRQGPMLFVGSKQNNSSPQILLLSTKWSATESVVLVSSKNGNDTKKKPDVILDYNKHMAATDTSDMICSSLEESRKVKCWRKFAFSIITKMVLNAYILYQANCIGKKMTRAEFCSSIISSLSAEWYENRKKPCRAVRNINVNTDICGVQLLPGKLERQCIVCSSRQQRKRSRTVCIRCHKGVHPRCAMLHKCWLVSNVLDA